MSLVKILRNLLVGAALLFGFAAGASAQDFHDSCKSDLETYCQFVTPGDGRIAACLYAHQDRISEPCYAATAGVDTLLEAVFDRLKVTYEACAADIQTHCADVAVGGGRILACLVKNAADVEPACLDSARGLGAALLAE